MEIKKNRGQEVFMAAREQGISSVLFRNALGRKLNLSVTDSECLSLLTIRGTSTPKDLAHYTGLTTGSTTAMLDRLEKAGYIKRTPNPNDRRGLLIEMSDKYATLAGPLVRDVQKAHHDLISSYSDKELETIADFLTRFTKNVTDQTKEIEK